LVRQERARFAHFCGQANAGGKDAAWVRAPITDPHCQNARFMYGDVIEVAKPVLISADS
jgi:hypothetical protein